MKKLFNLIIISCIILWIIKAFAWFTPHNILYQSGFGGLTVFDTFISPIIGIIFGIFSIKQKKKVDSKPLFILNQVLCWGLVFIPVAVILFLFVSVLFFGVQV